jgi:hypothetical protein
LSVVYSRCGVASYRQLPAQYLRFRQVKPSPPAGKSALRLRQRSCMSASLAALGHGVQPVTASGSHPIAVGLSMVICSTLLMESRPRPAAVLSWATVGRWSWLGNTGWGGVAGPATTPVDQVEVHWGRGGRWPRLRNPSVVQHHAQLFLAAAGTVKDQVWPWVWGCRGNTCGLPAQRGRSR